MLEDANGPSTGSTDTIDPVLTTESDVATRPNEYGDPPEIVRKKLPAHIFDKYEVYSYRNAAIILTETHAALFEEILDALARFQLTSTEIRMPGGNESPIPKAFSASLRPKGWFETVISGDLKVRLAWAEEVKKTNSRGRDTIGKERRERIFVRERFLDGHKIDYVKERVAFDLEWNSKDQTFDRDLYAFSAFAQCGAIDAAVLVTRSEELNTVFRSLGPALNKDGTQANTTTLSKYGASTTWMGKLLYRLNAGRNGSCPVLAFGILPACVADWSPTP
jgi:hypothetical protein